MSGTDFSRVPGLDMAGLRGRNVLFLLSDQHNAAVTGCYGDPTVRTPNLDRLAAEGALLENLYCTSPLCTPARMSLLTGRHPFQNRVWSNDHVLSSAFPTYAHAMGAAGYRPELIGKLHARGPDQLHGFVRRRYGDHGPAYIGSPEMERGRYQGTAGPQRVSIRASGRGQSVYDYRDTEVAIEACSFLEHFAAQRRAGIAAEPFSLTVGFLLPHPPYIARGEEYDYYEGRVPPPRVPASAATHPFDLWWREDRGIEDATQAEVMRSRAAYWALVDRMDQHVGSIIDCLDRNGLAQDTIVVYTSDHGDNIGEHGLFWKHTFYDGAARVPGIIRCPGVIPAGVRSDRVASSLDLTATILDAIGAPPLPASSGRSLLPLLRDDKSEWDDVAFCEGGLLGHIQAQRMIRRGRWKLCYYDGWPLQLFDLDADPDETRNLADDPGHADTVAELSAMLFSDWDPAAVTQTLKLLESERELLAGWYRTVRPEETLRWDPPIETTFLDDARTPTADP